MEERVSMLLTVFFVSLASIEVPKVSFRCIGEANQQNSGDSTQLQAKSFLISAFIFNSGVHV